MAKIAFGVDGRSFPVHPVPVVETMDRCAISRSLCTGGSELPYRHAYVSEKSRLARFVEKSVFFVCKPVGVVSFVPARTAFCHFLVGKRDIPGHCRSFVYGFFAVVDGGSCRLSYGRIVGDAKNAGVFLTNPPC